MKLLPRFSKIKQGENFIVFTYSNGYFNNAEIIKFSSDIEEVKLKNEFEETGYSFNRFCRRGMY